jgi:hypothetical protein
MGLGVRDNGTVLKSRVFGGISSDKTVPPTYLRVVGFFGDGQRLRQCGRRIVSPSFRKYERRI